ncbi:N1-acetylpolyamine oxidase [Stagonosporopsis vannaccii]|nr:N1-acetylpolyamine oxidase [Stagonosporopsis vannaccii]
MHLKTVSLLAAVAAPVSVHAVPSIETKSYSNSTTCRKTTVAVLGAGVAGITAAQALANQSITDFLIVEYNEQVGGRMRHANFGSDADGNPYVVELGANWISGTGTPDGPENPVWTFAKQTNLSSTYSNLSNIATFDETGASDYLDILDEYDEIAGAVEQAAGRILSENLQDRSQRALLSENGWKTKRDSHRKAVDWWMFDWDAAALPEESSTVFAITASNLTYYQFKDEDFFSIDQRGYNTWLKGEAAKFLQPNDRRLLFNTTVTAIEYSDSGVKVTNEDGSCIEAEYAICTFALGVLQEEVVEFTPALPEWKQSSIATFNMGTYTKIFMQFNETFWPTDKEFFLYAHPTTRGYYPQFQSLSTEGFFPGSNILFATVVDEQSARIEAQDDETTKAEIMEVLRQMFPDVDIPDPIDFMYPRWGQTPWTYGSYSNWPAGTTLEMHQNLRANVERLYFAGEHTSAEYFGFLHGSWFEGQEAGQRIAGALGKDCLNEGSGCGDYKRYEVLRGTTERSEYNDYNGMGADPFFVSEGDESDIGSLTRRSLKRSGHKRRHHK